MCEYSGYSREELLAANPADLIDAYAHLAAAEAIGWRDRVLVEIFRRAAGHADPLCRPDESLALVTDAALEHPHRFALEDATGLAAFIARRLDSLREY